MGTTRARTTAKRIVQDPPHSPALCPCPVTKGTLLHICLVAGMDSFHRNMWLMNQVLSLTLCFPLADSDTVPGCCLWHLLCPQLLHLGETLLWCGRCHPQPGACWVGEGHWADRDSLGFPDLSKWVTGGLAWPMTSVPRARELSASLLWLLV